MWVNKEDQSSFNFLAPAGASKQVNEVNFPLTTQEDIAAAATINVAGNFAEDVKNLGTLVGATTINATVNEQLKDGAKLILRMTDSGGAGDVVTFGTNLNAPAKTLASGGVYLITFILLDGAYYLYSDMRVA